MEYYFKRLAFYFCFYHHHHLLQHLFSKNNFQRIYSCIQEFFFNFLASDKNPYPLTYFFVFGSIEYCHIAKLEERVISIY